MARDLIHTMSPSTFNSRIDPFVAANAQPLLTDAKRFLAVAKVQEFNLKPEIVGRERLEALISEGCVELNRGLRPTLGQPATFYAEQFYYGAMYPGIQIAYGHGIYFAEPRTTIAPPDPNFPRISEVAVRYATMDGAIGVVVRCALKKEAVIMGLDQLRAERQADKNRLRRMGIEDLGTFAAALGIDAFWVEEPFDYAREKTWIVVNRAMLFAQRTGKKIARKDVLTAQ